MLPMPHYPDVRVRLYSRNPFALVSAVRQGLRRLHVGDREINRFTEEALRSEDPHRIREICSAWAAVDTSESSPGKIGAFRQTSS